MLYSHSVMSQRLSLRMSFILIDRYNKLNKGNESRDELLSAAKYVILEEQDDLPEES